MKDDEAVCPTGARRRGDRLVGTSRAVQTVVEQIAVAGRGHFPVWIEGEDGVDKDLVARLIHGASDWTRGEFLALDAGVVAEALLGRELFGCEPGAIPAVPEAYEGAFARTRDSTVMIESAERIPKDLQQVLARAIERGRYRRIGGTESLPLDARAIAASVRPLAELASGGSLVPEFAECFRLMVIQLPPLRDRPEDVVPLAAQMLSAARADYEHETGEACRVQGFSRDSLERLVAHTWPGNERELRELVRSAVRLASGPDIRPEDLAIGLNAAERIPSFRDAKRAFEREYVTRLLRMCRGNISQAARLAKKDRKDFYDVMRRNAINPVEFRT
jgi:two-component system response regulator GlrR